MPVTILKVCTVFFSVAGVAMSCWIVRTFVAMRRKTSRQVFRGSCTEEDIRRVAQHMDNFVRLLPYGKISKDLVSDLITSYCFEGSRVIDEVGIEHILTRTVDLQIVGSELKAKKPR